VSSDLFLPVDATACQSLRAALDESGCIWNVRLAVRNVAKATARMGLWDQLMGVRSLSGAGRRGVQLAAVSSASELSGAPSSTMLHRPRRRLSFIAVSFTKALRCTCKPFRRSGEFMSRPKVVRSSLTSDASSCFRARGDLY
jgi:hypothetical protein